MDNKKIIYSDGADAEQIRETSEIEQERVQTSSEPPHISVEAFKLTCPIFFKETSGSFEYDMIQARDELLGKYSAVYRQTDDPEPVPNNLPTLEAPAANKVQQLDLISPFKNPGAVYAMETTPVDIQTTAIAVQPSITPVLPTEIYTYKRTAPTAMELARHYLTKRSLRVVGSCIYAWNGNYYHRVTNAELKRDLISVMREKLEVKGSSGQLNDIVECIISEPTIAHNAVTPPPYLLNVGNGVLNLKSPTNFELFAPSPFNFFTSTIRTCWSGALPTPVFDSFLQSVAGNNPVLLERIWEVIGYLLSEDSSAKRFVLLLGPSNSGKSVFGNTIAAFFEDEFISAVSASGLGAQFSLAALKHARLNLSMDLTDAALSPQAVSIIKSITGRDLVPVEEKYQPISRCRIGCKLLFSSNHVLKLMTSDKALEDRILLLPFSHPIPKERQNPNLEAMIFNELPGILHKAMEAYCRLVGNNYIFAGDDIFTADMMSEAVLGLDNSISAEEAVDSFLRERCVRTGNDCFTPVNRLFEEYCAFASLNSNITTFSNAQTFSRVLAHSLTKFGFPSNSQKKFLGGKTFNVYRGIHLKEG